VITEEISGEKQAFKLKSCNCELALSTRKTARGALTRPCQTA
jgi:hypothetical protein